MQAPLKIYKVIIDIIFQVGILIKILKNEITANKSEATTIKISWYL